MVLKFIIWELLKDIDKLETVISTFITTDQEHYVNLVIQNIRVTPVEAIRTLKKYDWDILSSMVELQF